MCLYIIIITLIAFRSLIVLIENYWVINQVVAGIWKHQARNASYLVIFAHQSPSLYNSRCSEWLEGKLLHTLLTILSF